MHLTTIKTSVLQSMPNVSFGLVHFVGRAIPEMNSGRLGAWLEGEARRSILRKVRAGRPLAAKTGHSKIQKWCVTEPAKLKIDRPVDRPDEPGDLLQS